MGCSEFPGELQVQAGLCEDDPGMHFTTEASHAHVTSKEAGEDDSWVHI